ncbi:MAG: hypothetical protein JWR02_1609 [Mucilaginibacter sp.]|nr:hypothetical protein [Mucilaginibacter sp.]
MSKVLSQKFYFSYLELKTFDLRLKLFFTHLLTYGFLTVLRNGVAVDKRINYRFIPQRDYYCIITGQTACRTT